MSKCDVSVTNMPKKIRKQMKARKKEEKNTEEKPSEEKPKEMCTRTVNSDEVVLTIVKDEKSGDLKATDGYVNFPIQNPGDITVDEKWKCRLLDLPTGFVAYLVSYEGMAEPEAAVEEKIEEPVVDIAPVEEAPVETVPAEENAPVFNESDLVRELRKQLKEANTRNRKLEKELKDLPGLKDQIKKQGVALQNYRKQVQSLEKGNNVRNFENAMSEMNRYKADCETMSREIEKLKALLEMSMQSSKEDTPKAFITGDSSIYSAMFDYMRYRVYFSPTKKTLRFIPDENGAVTVNDKGVVIPALAGYSNFLKARPLEAERNGSEVLMSLS